MSNSGNEAEKLAATYLQQQGLTLLETNYRCRFGEIDLVMRDGKAFSTKVIYPKGNPNNPVTSEELVNAFRGMASYAARPISGAKIDEAVDLALRLEEIDDVALLAKLLTT